MAEARKQIRPATLELEFRGPHNQAEIRAFGLVFSRVFGDDNPLVSPEEIEQVEIASAALAKLIAIGVMRRG